MPRRNTNDDTPDAIDTTATPDVNAPDAPDADDPRTFEHDAAQAVREGELSAAQLAGGGGNVDPENLDAQYPPGRVDNLARTAPDEPEDLRSFVPERRIVGTGTTFLNTAATPDYGTNAEE